MYGLAQTTAPTLEPLTLAEVKRYVRVSQDISEHNEELTDLLKAARQDLEDRTNRQVMNASWTLKLDAFPYRSGVFYLPRAPLSSVTSITYLEAVAGASTAWSSSNYRVSTTVEPGEVRLAYGISFPSVYPISNAVTIVYVAGYGATQATVPPKIKQAIAMRMRAWWDQDKQAETAYESMVTSVLYGDEHTVYAECHE